jgi:DNA (cytosine-5)-methyltransferase 1
VIYFNENDSFAAPWLRNLWPDATVDDRDIQQVRAKDVAGFRRCHWFGGIGGWQYALELAGWPLNREVWTGSCPCQPFSDAGKRGGEKDERHLWPEFYRLVSERRPATIFGEQVASADGREWLDGISLDLEELGYAVGAADLPAASEGAPEMRQRFFWVGFASGDQLGRDSGSPLGAEAKGQRSRLFDGHRRDVSGSASTVSRLGDSANDGAPASEQTRQFETERHGSFMGLAESASLRWGQSGGRANDAQRPQAGDGCGLGITNSAGLQPRIETAARDRYWDSFVATSCTDGKIRRISAQPGDEPLAYGIPRDLGRRFPELRQVAKGARANRVGRLRGYGNAIVPQVAAVFIRAFLEATEP